MKVLVDECVTMQLLPHITGHEVTHVAGITWRGMKNGVLLRLAQTRFDVFARINRDYRVIGVMQGDTIIWFWIGPHDEYERLLTGLK